MPKKCEFCGSRNTKTKKKRMYCTIQCREIAHDKRETLRFDEIMKIEDEIAKMRGTMIELQLQVNSLRKKKNQAWKYHAVGKTTNTTHRLPFSKGRPKG